MTVSGGELLLDLLESCGVEYVFCSPGTEWTPVWKRWQNDNLKVMMP